MDSCEFLCRIPGHVGIPEKDMADRTTKRVIDNRLYEIKIQFPDFKPCITKYVNSLFFKPPVRARGVKSRMCPPYPQRVVKGD